MIQLNILSGKKAGTQTVVRRFPFYIGRDAQNNLQLEDDGIWTRHLALKFQKNEGFLLTAATDALTAVNGETAQNKILRNGDTITIGSVKLQFWLAAARQHNLFIPESFAWALLVCVTLAQFALLYWLIQ